MMAVRLSNYGMRTENEPDHHVESGTSQENWIAGGIAGVIAGVVFGVVMAATPMMENVATLLGMQGPAAGWVIHLIFSVLFAGIYVVIIAQDPVARYGDQPTTGAAIGGMYGIVLWGIGATIVMPVWLAGSLVFVDFELNWLSFVGHLFYGVILGTVYPLLLART